MHASADPTAYTFATNLAKVLDDAEALGLPYIGTPSVPDRYGNTIDAWKRAAAEFNAYGAAAKTRGMRFYHHNHAENSLSPPTTRASAFTTSCLRKPTRGSSSSRWTFSGPMSPSTGSPAGRTAPPPPSNPSTTS